MRQPPPEILHDDRGIAYVTDADLETLDELAALGLGRWTLCGTCRRAWDDETPTSSTPAPAGRCPFEYDHEPEPEPEELDR